MAGRTHLTLCLTPTSEEYIRGFIRHFEFEEEDQHPPPPQEPVAVEEAPPAAEAVLIPQADGVAECRYCYCRPCVTTPEPLWVGEQAACEANAALRKTKYQLFWSTMANMVPSPWLDDRYLRAKDRRMAEDAARAPARRRLAILAGGGVREIMPKCVLKLVRRRYPNPVGNPYLVTCIVCRLVGISRSGQTARAVLGGSRARASALKVTVTGIRIYWLDGHLACRSGAGYYSAAVAQLAVRGCTAGRESYPVTVRLPLLSLYVTLPPRYPTTHTGEHNMPDTYSFRLAVLPITPMRTSLHDLALIILHMCIIAQLSTVKMLCRTPDSSKRAEENLKGNGENVRNDDTYTARHKRCRSPALILKTSVHPKRAKDRYHFINNLEDHNMSNVTPYLSSCVLLFCQPVFSDHCAHHVRGGTFTALCVLPLIDRLSSVCITAAKDPNPGTTMHPACQTYRSHRSSC
ncbi:Neurexophilin [Branchiostoma belcheri]|nr:Neurexophilin [Branchiostoma belcheri]